MGKLIFVLVVPGLHCSLQALSRSSEWGLAFPVAHRLRVAVASLPAEPRLQVHRLQWLQRLDSVVVAHRPNCSGACRVYPDQG